MEHALKKLDAIADTFEISNRQELVEVAETSLSSKIINRDHDKLTTAVENQLALQHSNMAQKTTSILQCEKTSCQNRGVVQQKHRIFFAEKTFDLSHNKAEAGKFLVHLFLMLLIEFCE